MIYFKIEDYFKELKGSSNENNKGIILRSKINSYEYISQQIEFITNWRSNQDNVYFDNRVFGIPLDAILDLSYRNPNILNSINRYYDNNYNGDSNIDQFDKSNRNKDKNKFNDKRNWFEKHNFNKTGKAIKFIAKHLKAFLIILGIVILIIVLLNVFIYVSGILGSAGHTPFSICVGSMSTSTVSGGSKVKDGYKLPIDYILGGKDKYTGQNFTGDDNLRGIGYFASEDFAWDGTDKFSYENYAIAARWEYCSYSIKDNEWENHANEGNGSTDGIDTSQPYTNLNAAEYSWTCKQKVLVVNPQNHKGVVCMVGNGIDNPNYGGSPLSFIAGLSYKAQGALGFKVGTINGGDYQTNCADSKIKLEMFWVDDNTPVGPCDGSMLQSSSCDRVNLSPGNGTIADAAVSFAYESVPEGTPNSTPNNGNGTNLYVKIHDAIFPGNLWYQSCDISAASAIRWSGADDNFPSNSTATQLSYLQNNNTKWKEIDAHSEKDLQPGDLLIANNSKIGHIIIYTGNDIVKKKFPNSNGVMVSGSIGSAISPSDQIDVNDNRPPCVETWYNLTFASNNGDYHVFRNIQPETKSKYTSLN
jgi:hypothetical protein